MTTWARKIVGRAGPLVLALGLVGCGTTDQLGGASAAGGNSFADRVGRMFATHAPTPEPAAEDKPKEKDAVDYECPSVTIRTGAAAYPVFATSRDQGQTLRYQATIGQTARECAALGAMMTMKIGVEGRLLAGPAGGPGKVDIPMRVAVVHEGTTPKTIWSKFYRVGAQMPVGQAQTAFLLIDEDVSFSLPKADDLENYVVYVGFDPNGQPEKTGRQSRNASHGG
ncbi:hypothetical protein [Blastochloris viridis]|uniref:Lipoprotein n=1 Tax=Blastochloris viridis TaxID=1079 RepID=A0A0P0J9X1_BLAVI|nr:hypothetical protein [Blastochloris viridis]ALK10455.1 hypothetical protein BVIR_2690 [Blastochloris viridis]CUU43117.1 hypothetical protein BVIRIDIS_21340 [Blastochloris viridis]